MCGLAASVKSGSEGKVLAAAEMMSYRGHRMKSSGMLAHVRLPIVGLGEEHDQPVSVPRSWRLAFVGELLDFYEYAGVECDLDLVVRTWATVGPPGFGAHDGFWAVCAVEETQRQVHLLCDYLAQKPLYYRLDEAAAASELDAVASFGPVTPDRLYLSDVCKWGYCPDTRRTPYAEVSRVLPGEYVVFDDRGHISRSVADSVRPEGDETTLKYEIEKAVERRVIASDVGVGCLLSGGFDSALVYTIACRHRDVVPYFVKGNRLECGEDDLGDARGLVSNAQVSSRDRYLAIMKKFAADVRPAILGPDGAPLGSRADRPRAEDFLRSELVVVDASDEGDLRPAPEVMQEPIDLGSLRPQWDLANAVRQHVCLTGDGADELFGGYRRALSYDSQASDVMRELVNWHLPRLDRVMMRNRVEVRSPFLARKVVNAALNLPYPLRRGKAVLRRLFRDDLPGRVVDKGKVPLRVAMEPREAEAYRIALVDEFIQRRWPS